MASKKHAIVMVAALAALLLLPAPAAWADDLVASKRGTSTLFVFDSDDPGDVDRRPIEGMRSDEGIEDIAVRSGDGKLYILSDENRVYLVNLTTRAAVPVAAGVTASLDGRNFGIDFDPVGNRLRVVSDNDENLSINPNDALATPASTLRYSPDNQGDEPESPEVVAAAYTNPNNPERGTQLYVLDTKEDAVYLVDPPDGGLLSNKQTLEIDITTRAGLDFSHDNRGYVVISSGPNGESRLYYLNPRSGDTTDQGRIDQRGLDSVATLNIRSQGMAPPTPAPAPPAPTSPPADPPPGETPPADPPPGETPPADPPPTEPPAGTPAP